MKYLTLEKLKKRAEELNSNYWREGANYRWEYMSYVIDMLKVMGVKDYIAEAGSSRMPLHRESYLLDYPEYDLNVTPFINKKAFKPIIDKAYNCFVALQTWEHLDEQQAAFREVMRISESAILSFPYLWKHGDARHRGVDKKRIAEWTCNVEPVHVHQIKSRIIYVWRFEQ